MKPLLISDVVIKNWWEISPEKKNFIYYCNGSRCWFCICRKGKREYQGSSWLSPRVAYNRLRNRCDAPPFGDFVTYKKLAIRQESVIKIYA